LHPLLGYVVGLLDIISQCLFAASVCGYGAHAISLMIDDNHYAWYAPLYWLVVYGVGVPLDVPGLVPRKFCYYAMLLFGVVGFLLAVIYVLGTSPGIDGAKYLAVHSDHRTSAYVTFFAIIPASSMFLKGWQSVPIVSSNKLDPSKIAPWGQLVGTLLISVMAAVAVLVACAQYPGTQGLSGENSGNLPLSHGWSRMTGWSFGAYSLFILPAG
jgi:hypothetical protein